MSGLAAVIGSGAGRHTLAPLVHALEVSPTERSTSIDAAGAVLAHVSLGIGGEDGGVARRGSQVLAVAGDVPGLDSAGNRMRPLAERLLERVSAQGPKALADLNGVIAACLWDERTATATLANDRLGIGRLYYRVTGDGLRVASRARALADRTDVDFRALGQLLQVGYPLEDRTLFPGVRLLPPASLATWHAGRLLIRRVWEPPPPGAHESDPDQAAEALAAALERAVSRVLDSSSIGSLALVLPLSGGLDSRTLLGLAGTRPAAALSYGHGHSWDLRFGAQLASAAGVRHQRVFLGPDYMPRFGPRGVYLTDGEAPLHAFHVLCLNPWLAQQPSSVLSGFLGDAITGAHLGWVEADDLGREPAAAARALFDRHYRIGFTDEELARLLRRPVAREAEGAAFDAFLSTYRRGEGPYGSADRVDLELRQRRFVAYQLTTLGATALVRAPFADREVIDAALGLPLPERLGQTAYRRAITHTLPHLARVPQTATRVPLAGSRPLLALRRRLEWWRRRGIPRLTGGLIRPHDYRQYAHYDAWIREGARGFFAELIEDRALLDDLLDLEQVADLFKRHLEGRVDAHGRLAAVATLALWRRQMNAGSASHEPAAIAAG